MTEQITVPSKTWDAMREALERMLDLWDRTRESGAMPMDYVRCKAALTAANADRDSAKGWTRDSVSSP